MEPPPSALVTVLSHLRGEWLDALAAELGVLVVPIPAEGELDPEVRGDVLLTSNAVRGDLGDVLDRGVRWVHTFGTGVDQLPLDQLGDRVLTCTRGASAEPIGEWILAVILAAAKGLPDVWIDAPPERWNIDRRVGTVRRRKVAFLGFGSIAREAARLLLALDADVVATRRRTDLPVEPDGVRIVTEPAEAVAGADHVVVAAAATPATRQLVDAALLAAMAPGVHLVNIARGSLVDQDALRDALDRGHVGLATLDTVDPEPLPDGHWLYTHPRVRLSAHVSWSTPDNSTVLRERFADNLRRFLAGDPLEGVVDTEAGY